MDKEHRSPGSGSSSGGSSSRQFSIARTAPESGSILSASRGRHTTMRGRDRAFGGGNNNGFNARPDHHHQRQTSPDELYEIASVFKPVPGYERPWEMAPPRYWGQLRRLFLEESMKSSSHKDKESPLGSGSGIGSGKASSLMAGSTSAAAITSTPTNELDSTSGASSSSGSLGSFSISRGSTSVHAYGSMMGGGPSSDVPMSPVWEVGPPPKHWPCLYNMKRQDDHNHHHHHHHHNTHNQGSKLYNNVIPSSRITFDQSNLSRDQPN